MAVSKGIYEMLSKLRFAVMPFAYSKMHTAMNMFDIV